MAPMPGRPLISPGVTHPHGLYDTSFLELLDPWQIRDRPYWLVEFRNFVEHAFSFLRPQLEKLRSEPNPDRPRADSPGPLTPLLEQIHPRLRGFGVQ